MVPTTRDLVDRAQGWRTRGFIEPQVWDSIRERVAFQLPEENPEPRPLSQLTHQSQPVVQPEPIELTPQHKIL